MNIWKKITYLEAPDILNQLFLISLSVIIIVNYKLISAWYIIVIINLVLGTGIVYVVSLYESMSEYDKSKNSLWKILRYWYPCFMILFCFKIIYIIMYNIEKVIYDNILIYLDYKIFGFNPTEAVFGLSNPVLTEILQIIYILFYIMPLIFGIEIFLKKRYNDFKYLMFVLFLGFYLSFFGYLILPAIGPRFTLHDFHLLNNDLPGVFLTNVLRDIINFGESIPKYVPDPEEFAQRDAFPSGHSIIILLIVYLSRKFKCKSFRFYLPYAALMLFSTIYLRYHYVVDVIAGFIIAILTVLMSELIYKTKKSD
ncbi:MAG: phosphatase PAP2 family protein [Ignavibacteria bacterium]|nr:phosphatase PAP2 family protein [Ignavibacteria bacterium]